jgi:capsular exopolysaccharide synthesis family protein
MSKIQEALDKIKAAQEKSSQLEAADRASNISHIDNETAVDAKTYADRLVEEMHEPIELTPEDKAKKRIICSTMRDRKVFNSFRNLRTTVLQKTKVQSPIIMVTSCTNKGGGSFVSLNLPAAIAMDEAKTSLLIDCNLIDSSFSDLPISDKNNNIGLKNYLKDKSCHVKDIIYPMGVQRMRVIPSGNIDIPTEEFFTSSRLRNLFDEIKKRYEQRYIIVDAPPLTESADARILAQACDYVILVVPYGKATEEQVLANARAIGKEKLLGTVFNNEMRLPRLSWK